MKTAIRFFRDETAATSIEYALLASGIALAIVVAVNSIGTSMNTKYTAVKAALRLIQFRFDRDPAEAPASAFFVRGTHQAMCRFSER